MAVTVSVASRDSIGSGSFDIQFDGSYMSLDSVVAGSKAADGATFDFSTPAAVEGTALAAAMSTTVSFSGCRSRYRQHG